MTIISTCFACKENIPKSRYSVDPWMPVLQDTGVTLGTWVSRPTQNYLELVHLMGYVSIQTK